MKLTSKNYLTTGLMVCSVVLLIVLQLLWLRSSYEKAYFELKRETNLALRITIDEMRDSLIFRNMEPISKEEIKDIYRFSHRKDSSISISTIRRSIGNDSIQRIDSNVKIILSTPLDSVDSDAIRPIVRRIDQMKKSEGLHQSFVISLTQDTLNADSLSMKYKVALAKNKINVPFDIRLVPFRPHENDELPIPGRVKFLMKKRQAAKEENIFANRVSTDAVVFNPPNNYAATFTDIRSFLLRTIAPEILFSFFLTMITIAAFGLVYSNMRRQQRLMKVKDEFISNVSHELKTPVATVSVALEALKNFSALDNPVLTKEYLDIAQRELGRLSAITDRILKTSVLEHQPGKIVLESLDLHSITRDVLTGMRLIADATKATLNLNLKGERFFINGSREHLSSMLYNLVDNAIKYSGDHALVTISLEERENEIHLSVKDNGIGIERAYHSKVFEKFFRVPIGDVHNIKGYGLGLNYVHTVVTLHSGTIQLISEPGIGSEFIIIFKKTVR